MCVPLNPRSHSHNLALPLSGRHAGRAHPKILSFSLTLLPSDTQTYQAADKLKAQLQSLSLIYNKAMAAAAASGDVQGTGRSLSSTHCRSDQIASGAPGSLLFSMEEEMDEIERKCSASKRRAVQEAKTMVAAEDETMRNARDYCEKSLCALQLLQREML